MFRLKTQPQKLPATVTDDDFIRWVCMGRPEHEHDNIMSLPLATLNILYPKIRMYGPNADSVDKFIQDLPTRTRFRQDLPASTRFRQAGAVGDKYRDRITFLPYELRSSIGQAVHAHVHPDPFSFGYHQTATVAAQLIAADGFNPGSLQHQNFDAVSMLNAVVNLNLGSYQFTVAG